MCRSLTVGIEAPGTTSSGPGLPTTSTRRHPDAVTYEVAVVGADVVVTAIPSLAQRDGPAR